MAIQVRIMSEDECEDERLHELAQLIRDLLDDEGMIYAKGESENRDNSGRCIYLTDVQ